MATGVLVLGVDRGTKLLTFLVGCDKAYAATIRLGQSTITDDAEGETSRPLGVDDVPALERDLRRCRGPAHGRHRAGAQLGQRHQGRAASAATPACGRATRSTCRRARSPSAASRCSPCDPGRVQAEVGPPVDVVDVDVEVEVSSGTYVRALARDLGDRARGRRPPDRAAPHPGRPLRPRRGAHARRARRAVRARRTGRHTAPADGRGGAGPAARPRGQRRRGRAPRARPADRRAAPERAEAVAAIDPSGRLVAVLDETAERARAKVVFAAAGAGA